MKINAPAHTHTDTDTNAVGNVNGYMTMAMDYISVCLGDIIKTEFDLFILF